ncbi:MAG: two-component system LytT family response regulator [Cyclobacteriaceae bacterium]|jgi:two-component system LytT family response regulator
MKISCIAVDDEPLALDKITDYISQVPFLDLKGQFENGLEALTFLQQNDVDLLFLDIQMPQILGTQLLQIINKKPQVILTTAYSEYAIEGFNLDVVDYLLKPISFGRFLQATQKALDRKSKSPSQPTIVAFDTSKPDYFFVKTETKLQKVRFDNILYVEGLRDYLSIYTKTERILTLQNFNELLEKLPPYFVRVHKSFAVSMHQIDQIEKARVLIGEKYIAIGETYKRTFMESIKKYS